MVLEVYPLLLSKPILRCMPYKGRIFGLSVFAVPKFPSPTLLYLQIWPLSFAPGLKRLPDLLCMGPNTPLHTQVSVSLVPYKPIVSYYYFPVGYIKNEIIKMISMNVAHTILPSKFVCPAALLTLWRRNFLLNFSTPCV